MILIELIGPAGSGKTTLIKELALATDNHINYKKPLKSYNTYVSIAVVALSFFSKKVALSLFLFLFLFFEKNKKKGVNLTPLVEGVDQVLSVKMSLLWRVKRVKLFADSFSGFLLKESVVFNCATVLEEGPAQRATTLLYSNVPMSKIASYIDISPLPDLLILLKVDPEFLAERVADRDGLKSDYYSLRKNAIDLVESTAEVYRVRGCEVFELDANLSPEKNSQILIAKINSIV